jgi:hypothetical protein
MGRRSRLAAVIGGAAVMALAAWAVLRLYAPTVADRSLAQIRVSGYQKTGGTSDGNDGDTDATASFMGPATSRDGIAAKISGPGVTASVFSPQSPLSRVVPIDNEIWIGRGTAPLGCGLLIYQFRPAKTPYPWWHITSHQLALVRAGKLSIFEITTACGGNP